MKKFLLTLTAVALCISGFSQNHHMTFRSRLQYPGQTLANIWGYVDSLGNEYALVGASQGLSIVNVTDPDSIWEVAQIPGPDDLWKEVKTWGRYAYVTTEDPTVQGLQIIDLGNLPGTNLPSKYWGPVINGVQMTTIHALHIDNGFAYLYGVNGQGSSLQGAVIADLTDPWNPTVAGVYNEQYIHDGYVRNNKLYAGHIYAGYFAVIDVTDKANPVVVETQNTPGNFTHNTWLSDNSQVLFTTDEVSNSYLTSYDITDLSDINELDRFQTTPGSGSIVHNTHILNDYAVTSWYRDGVVVVDGHRPQNLVEVGRYDTYPGSGDGFDGDWGVYPFLPSGNLVVSNIDEGLFVISPNYVRAAYLEGTITDSICGTILPNVRVTISGVNVIDSTKATGEFKTGTHTPGTYTVTLTKTGYQTRTITGVNLVAGQVTNLNAKMFSSSTVTISGSTKNTNNVAIPSVKVQFTNSGGTVTITSNGTGNFSKCDILPGNYTMTATKWGYRTDCQFVTVSSGSVFNIQLTPELYDDFSSDNGWTVTSTSPTGTWTIAKPVLLSSNGLDVTPDGDELSDCGDKAYITGPGDQYAGQNDIDNGYSLLTSPVFDLTSYNEPYLNYVRWFFNSGGSSQPNDSMKVMISNGDSTVVLETVTDTSSYESSWVERSFKLKDYIGLSANMQLSVKIADDGANGHLVEGGFDKFEINDNGPFTVNEKLSTSIFNVYPNPSREQFMINYSRVSNATAFIYDCRGALVHSQVLTGEAGTVVINADLQAGLYLLKVNEGSIPVYSSKIIKY